MQEELNFVRDLFASMGNSAVWAIVCIYGARLGQTIFAKNRCLKWSVIKALIIKDVELSPIFGIVSQSMGAKCAI